MNTSPEEPETKLSENTWVPLGKTLILGAALFSGLWMVSGAVHQLQATVDELRRDRWTATDMDRWSVLLERANRGQTPALVVPDVRDVQAVTRRLGNP